MSYDHDSEKGGDEPRGEARSGHHDDGTSPASNEYPASSGESQDGHLDRMAGDLRRCGKEYPDSQDEALDGELLPRIQREVRR